MEKKKPFIRILPDHIEYGYNARYKLEPSGYYSWHIPSFDIYFSSKSKEDGSKRAKAITQSFFNYWIGQEGFERFIDKIGRLGYKAPSKKQLNALLHRRRASPVELTPDSIPFNKEYDEAESFDIVDSIRA